MARANVSRNPPVVGFQRAVAIIAAESLEKKKAAKDLAAAERKKKEPTAKSSIGNQRFWLSFQG